MDLIIILLPVIIAVGIILFSTVKIDWNIPSYKKIFYATMLVMALSVSVRAYIIFHDTKLETAFILQIFDNLFTLSLFPFLNWFIASIIVVKHRFSIKNLLQFLPAFVVVVGGIVTGGILRQEYTVEQIFFMHADIEPGSTLWWYRFFNNTLMDISLFVQIITTSVYAVINISLFRRDAERFFSDLCEDGYQHFLRILILVIITSVAYSSKFVANIYISVSSEIALVFSVLCVILIGMLFYSVNRICFNAEILSKYKEDNSIDFDDVTDDGCTISEQDMSVKAALDEFKQNDSKPYLKQGYTISDLSNDIGLPVKMISVYLNHVEKRSFFVYIAMLRFQEAKKLMMEPANYSLLYVATVCGFSDVANFSRSFKNIEGVTPGAWREQNKV